MKRPIQGVKLPSTGDFPASRTDDPHVVGPSPNHANSALTGPKKIVNKAHLYFGA